MKNILVLMVFILMVKMDALSQSSYKNGLSIESGYGGGDGIFPTYIYGLEYLRSLSSRFDGYFRYSSSMGANNQRMEALDEKFIKAESTADFTDNRYSQFYSFGVGIKAKVVKTTNSFLYFNLGAMYVSSKYSFVDGWLIDDGVPIIVNLELSQSNRLGYEFGVGYNRIFKERYYAGGAVYLLQVDSRISASAVIGILF